MNRLPDLMRHYASAVVALSIIAALYLGSRQPNISDAERKTLADQFSFTEIPLLEDLGTRPLKNVRRVAPSLQRISGWVSSTGAAIALNDLDGDGLANDVCSVDPRTDAIIVAPAPDADLSRKNRFKQFVLEAGTLVDKSTMAPMGCVPNDYDADGRMDLLIYYWGRTPIIFFADAPQPESSFGQQSFVPVEIIPDARWFTGAVTVADVDGDGRLDIIVGNYYQDGAEILDVNASTPQAMQHSMTRASNGGGSRILRWIGEGDDGPRARYEEVTDYVEAPTSEVQHEVTHGWTLAIGACDLDGDLLPELYFANDFGPDRLLHNISRPGQVRFKLLSGKKGFTTPNSKVVGNDGFKGMGVDFADFNGDGLFDFYVSNIAAEYALEESHFLFVSTGQPGQMSDGVAPYVDSSEEFGVSRSDWAWDTKAGDFDNNGEPEILQAKGFLKGEADRWPELHETAMGNDQLLADPGSWHRFQPGDDLSGDTHTSFFVRSSSGRFYDLSEDVGLGRRQIGRGIATADVNGDGLLDFANANQWEGSFLYLNQSVGAGDYLGLRLRLPVVAGKPTIVSAELPNKLEPSRPAIGAWARVVLPSGKQLVTFVDGGNGHSGRRSNDVLFGLGKLPPNSELSVEVRWRDGARQIREKVLRLSNGWFTVILGED